MHDFTYDPFQQKAIEYINEGHSVLVSAPTGAGKTVIAEHVINQCLEQNKKVIYTAPIKALSNQKFRDFQKVNPDIVGILTGDVTLNGDAPILIMTTEIFRNKILDDVSSLDDYSWIIFDEIHYIDDWDRGSVWEESLIFFPEHMNFLGLSATIPNIHELADWMKSIHQHLVKVVTEANRPVPLHVYFQCQGRLYDDVKNLVRYGYRSDKFPVQSNRRIPRHIRLHTNSPFELLEHIRDSEMLPCIYFAFSRRLTERLAEEATMFNFVNKKEREEILQLYDQLVRRFELQDEHSMHKLRPLIGRGIAYHHAGMLPTLKETVEQLFTSRKLKVIFTTETFALGINMPAKAVVFDELRKFYGKGFDVLKTRDFYQMAGRAGRRGIDKEGHVFCRINPHFISPEELQGAVYNPPEKVNSQFNASYATLLNLYSSYGEKLYDIYPLSFHHFQVRNFLKKRAVQFMRNKVKVLYELGHIDKAGVTPKGQFGAKVYGYELMLSELYESGVMDQMDPVDLALLAVATVYEPRKGSSKPALSIKAYEIERHTKKAKRIIHKVEKRCGISALSKRCYFHLSPGVEAWIEGKRFDEILELMDADEGEVVRYLRMSIQVLREIKESPISDRLEQNINQVIAAMNRDVVDSQRQLSM